MTLLTLNLKKRRFISAVILALTLLTLFISTARAGDIANRHFWGVSAEGSYFAFEEYGVQDGSGFAYSNFYIINTRKNSWIKNTPIRVLGDDEKTSLKTVRTEALKNARSFMEKFGIAQTGQLLAHNPVTELNRDPHNVRVAPGPAPFLHNHALSFRLEQIPLKTARCDDYGTDSQIGYKLSLRRKDSEPALLHEDTRIPRSRGCPRAYAISDIIRFQPDETSKETLYIVLIQVFSYGFEGNDGRYLALSAWLPTFNTVN